MLERFAALSWQQVLLAACLALIVFSVIRFIQLFFFGSAEDSEKQTWGEAEMQAALKRCREMFPIETVFFHGTEFQSGTRIRITTTQEKIIEGELIGMNQIHMICIRSGNQIIAHQLEKIQEIIQL